MFKTGRLLVIGWAVWGCALPAAADANKAKVSLHPAVTAVSAGATFEVGIQFEVAEGWHIYWKNAGDSGMPPRINWKLPPGFEVGKLGFPAPEPHDDPGGFQTNVLEGSPVLIQTLTAPKDLAAGGKIKLEADLSWLVCQKQCLLEKGTVSVELPAVATAGEVKPAEEALFKRARAALPLAPEKAKYVKVAATSVAKSAKPGDAIEIAVDLTVLDGHHVQSNRPTLPGAVGTHVFVEPSEAADFEKVAYPPGEEKSHPQLGKVSEYRGRIPFKIPAVVRDDATGDRIRVAGLVTSQACNDKTGVCYPPEHVEWSLEIPLSGAAASAEAVPPSETASGPPPGDQPAVAASETQSPAVEVPEGAGLEGFLKNLGLPGLLLGCFLYGLFINATPCVLPLLSIKVLGFVQQAHESRKRTAALGLAFGIGVMLFFVVLGFLASRGQNILQYPVAVIALGAVVMALALSMLGVYTLQVPNTATKLDAAIQTEGMWASFGKGALAPVLGFACTGPLLAGAFGWATQQEPRIAFLAFLITGLGMATPYILLGANPKWLSFLPKPGPWMITFERIMGFLLLGMVIWLLHPLTVQLGVVGFEWTMGFLIVVAMACWVWGKIDFNMDTLQRWRYRGGALAMIAVAGFSIYGWMLRAPPGEIVWQPWSAERVEEAVRSGKTVFVDFTAAYCTQCKVNKAVAINTQEVRRKLEKLGVISFQGDYTSQDPAIFAMLQKHGRAGVPMNLIYPAGKPDAPVLLDTALSKRYLLRKLDEAGPSREDGNLVSARGRG